MPTRYTLEQVVTVVVYKIYIKSPFKLHLYVQNILNILYL